MLDLLFIRVLQYSPYTIGPIFGSIQDPPFGKVRMFPISHRRIHIRLAFASEHALKPDDSIHTGYDTVLNLDTHTDLSH